MTKFAELPTDEDRRMLKQSVRNLLAQHWPVEKAVEFSESRERIRMIQEVLAQNGLTALGTDAGQGGLREVLTALEELGRAACPVSLISAFMANTLLSAHPDLSPKLSEFLKGVHRGSASVSVVFGEFDGDRRAGKLRLDGGALNGAVSFVEAAESATHFLALVEPGPYLALVERNARGVTVVPTPGYAVPSLSQVSFDNVASDVVCIGREFAWDVSRISRLAMIARSLGAASRVFELAVEYAKVRRQFGTEIGRFQSIQHKLADCSIALEGSRLTLANAASSFDSGLSTWRVFSSAAFAFASRAIRQVSLEAHHVFAAIGYSEEHEAPRHFRRVHADLVRHGGVSRARAELAEYLLDSEEFTNLPDYDLGPDANAFRNEVRNWINENWNDHHRALHRRLPFADRVQDEEFTVKLGKKGWIGVGWPKKYGGQARTTLEQLAYVEELYGARAPAPGISYQGRALIKYGSEEQKEKFLPAIMRGEISFCLGYSEPESGSDLASLRTSAVRDGDEWVINGQKVWTTGADWMTHVWLAARTNAAGKTKHDGISMFIIPLNTPGITVRPSMALYGRTFCTVFYDNVRVPLDAVVGSVDKGWEILKSALADERISLGGVNARTRAVFGRLVEHLKTTKRENGDMKSDPIVRDRIGRLAAEIEVARQLFMNSIRVGEGGVVPVREAAMSKAFSGELMEAVGEEALDIVGTTVSLAEGASGSILDGELDQLLRHSIMYVVGGGTAQVQRNLIALHGLNLPK